MFLASLAVAAVLLFQVPYRHEKPAFELDLPSQQWRMADQTAGSLLNCAFSPTPDAITRAVVMTFPTAMLPKGLASREEQQKAAAGDRYVQIGMESGKISGRDATRWEYSVGNSTIVEWAFADGDTLVVFQLAAPLAVWANANSKARLDAIQGSFRWYGGASVDSNAIRSTPDEVRNLRASLASQDVVPNFVVTRHRIAARIEPAASTLEMSDALELEIREDEVAEIQLHTSIVTVDRVESESSMRWRIEPAEISDTLVITFDPPQKRGSIVTLTVHAKSEGFTRAPTEFAATPSQLHGRIESSSTYSSHALWYPIDRTNQAEVEITFDVPAPYSVLSGGERGEPEESDGRIRTRFVETTKVHRSLPFGFVLTDGTELTRKLDSGLEVSLHGYGDQEEAAKKVLSIASDAAALLERRFGGLPWRELRFVRLSSPVQASLAILPGMILMPAALFDSIADADLSEGNLADMKANGMLILIDAVSRQWTGMGADLSNELIEGLANFAKALFAEARHGDAAYRNTIAFCRTTWLSAIGQLPEYAIADPRVMSNRLFLPTAGCKTPVVLHLLRRVLGDEKFFAGLQHALFQSDRKLDSFVRLETSFAKTSGTDLRAFFDTWFHRSGAPVVKMQHTMSATSVDVTVYQMQGDDAYPLAFSLEIVDEKGAITREAVALDGKDWNATFAVSGAKSVSIVDRGCLPARFE